MSKFVVVKAGQHDFPVGTVVTQASKLDEKFVIFTALASALGVTHMEEVKATLPYQDEAGFVQVLTGDEVQPA